ncbi:MAG: pilus assembly protein PilX [Gammaproteobacteria bacterium]|nr:pilus assembly protein PilX [Gammaproteobacteria bacterium]
MKRHEFNAQQGVAMLVVLVFTLALTGIAIVSARLALLGESVARNQLDLQVARQAAEAALRDAEKDLMIADESANFPGAVCKRQGERPVMAQVVQFSEECLHGQCLPDLEQRRQVDYTKGAENIKLAEAWWPEDRGGRWGEPAKGKPSPDDKTTCTTFTGAVPLGVYTGAKPIQGVAFQPEYLIETILRGEDTYFRVTARGFGYRAGTEVVLQSYFLVPPLQ